jgi:hypothetical protein
MLRDAGGERGDDPPGLGVGVLLAPKLLAEIAHLFAQLLDQRVIMLTTFGLSVGVPSVVGMMLGGILGACLVVLHNPPILRTSYATRTGAMCPPDCPRRPGGAIAGIVL